MTTEGEEETISLEDEFEEALVEDAQWREASSDQDLQPVHWLIIERASVDK